MLLNEILNEMSSSDQSKLKTEIIKLFLPLQIKVLFTPHFDERSLDNTVDLKGIERGSSILHDEVLDLLTKIRNTYESEFKSGQYMKGILRDNTTYINIPFTFLFQDKRNTLVLRSIMKKQKYINTDPNDILLEIN